MAVKICGRMGICKVDKDGNIKGLQREYFRQGWIFKDWDAFRDYLDAGPLRSLKWTEYMKHIKMAG